MKHVLLFSAILFLNTGCASFGDNMFLVNNLDDASKSAALTKKGIEAYKLYIVEKEQYDKVEVVKQFFEVAQRYDTDNLEAVQYLVRLDTFQSDTIREQLSLAKRLLAKSVRKESEEYIAFVALRTVLILDNSNNEAIKLLYNNNAQVNALANRYVQRGKETMGKAAAPNLSNAQKEALYLSAYTTMSRALKVFPSSGTAETQKKLINQELAQLFEIRKNSVASCLKSSKFEDARIELAAMRNISDTADSMYASQVDACAYDLYYKWASAQYGKRQFNEALETVRLALAVNRTDEALALRKKITARKTTQGKATAFDTIITEIDRLIARSDFARANDQIVIATRLTQEKDKLDILAAKKTQVVAAMEDLYQKGLTAYRAEDYKTAVSLFSIVVKIDSSYQQAGKYLERSEEKLKLVNQFKD